MVARGLQSQLVTPATQTIIPTKDTNATPSSAVVGGKSYALAASTKSTQNDDRRNSTRQVVQGSRGSVIVTIPASNLASTFSKKDANKSLLPIEPQKRRAEGASSEMCEASPPKNSKPTTSSSMKITEAASATPTDCKFHNCMHSS